MHIGHESTIFMGEKYLLICNDKRPVSRPILVILYNYIKEQQNHQFSSSFDVGRPFLEAAVHFPTYSLGQQPLETC